MEAPPTSRFPGLRCISLVCIFVAVLVLSVSVQPSYAVSELVDKVCNQTSNYTFCVDVFNSDPPNDHIIWLAYTAIRAASASAENTTTYIGSLLNGTADPALEKKSLRRCEADYEDADDRLVRAFSSLDDESYDDFEPYVNEAAGKVHDCESRLKGTIPPVSARNKELKALCQICVVVAKFIMNGGIKS